MVLSLRMLFSIIFLSMLAVTIRASTMESLFNIPAVVTNDPWFIATLFDAYAGFLTFYAWVFYKTPKIWARIAWLVAILLLGNVAMSFYMLWLLFRLPANASPQEILLRSSKD
ncbi:MAG: DUF1475 family protein [Vampirovibrionales bacterium]|nr:DUF1475 family protein [Vampirovibrionales bacterium]